MHPKVRAHEGRGSRGPLCPFVVGTLVLVEVERLPSRGERRREPQVLWLWWHGPEGAVPDLDLLSLEGLCSPLRSGAHLPLPQAKLRVERPARTPSRASRPVDVAGGGRFHPAQAGARAHVADQRLPWERRYDPDRLTPHRHGYPALFRRFWGSWARLPSRQNPAGGLPEDPKDASRAGRNATRPSRRAPEPVENRLF
jgi:hypothetical protein